MCQGKGNGRKMEERRKLVRKNIFTFLKSGKVFKNVEWGGGEE